MSDPNDDDDDEESPMSFAHFPDDVQLCVLSFLSPSDICSFASASKRCFSLCRRTHSRLWHAMCHRRWGSLTDISLWHRRGTGTVPFRLLYRALSRCDAIIGFWRRSGGDSSSPPLILFEWGPHCVAGSRVSPSTDGTYSVVKSPFLWVSLSAEGETVGFLDDGRGQAEAVAVNVSFVGRNHIVVEEEEEDSIAAGIRRSSSSKNLRDEEEEEDDGVGSEFGSPGSLPDRLVSEVYQHFANRTSPVGERATRRQRRREKERRARRRRWDPQHFVKIVNCSPTPAKPLQGLWKGIYDDDMNLGFYLIAYDDIGWITCRKVWNSPQSVSNYGQLFWVSDSSLTESPLPAEEQALYAARVHLRPIPEAHCIILEDLSLSESSVVSRILHINSSFDLVFPYSESCCARAKGRIWQYEDGTFGFGFLEDNFVIDLKRVSENGFLLDASGLSGD